MLRIGRVLPGLIAASTPDENPVASFQAFRGQDVTAFTVFVQNQRDVRGTVRIVLKTFNNCRDTVFVAFEVNNTVSLLVATTDMTSGDTAIVVTTTGFAVFFSNGAKGLPLCSSGLTTLTTWRRPGDVGLHLTTAIVLLLRLTRAPPTKSRFWPSFRVT